MHFFGDGVAWESYGVGRRRVSSFDSDLKMKVGHQDSPGEYLKQESSAVNGVVLIG